MRNNLKVGIVTTPVVKAGVEPLLNLMNILHCYSDDISIITGNEFTKENNPDKRVSTILTYYYNYNLKGLAKVLQYISLQLKISFGLLYMARNVDFLIFFLGGSLVLPMLASKVLNKKVILIVTGSGSASSKFRRSLFSKSLHILERICYTLSNRIILYSPNLIKEYNLEKYENKILIAHRHFLDFDKFKIKREFHKRDSLVSYIGRLSGEKGVMNFVKAIPLILKQRDDLEYLIGGEGQLRAEIEKYINKNNLTDKVKLAGWIPHDELPDYLNELKLLVLPSYTEGLPNIMLEAMACGTPVLATPVGTVPDIIKDGETGFMMENNSPECIAKNVLRILNNSELDKIVKNARELVEKEFTYEAAVERYIKILSHL